MPYWEGRDRGFYEEGRDFFDAFHLSEVRPVCLIWKTLINGIHRGYVYKPISNSGIRKFITKAGICKIPTSSFSGQACVPYC